MAIDMNHTLKTACDRSGASLQFCSMMISALLLGGCASPGAPDASEASATAVKTSASEPPLGEIAYDERTRHDCSSKKPRTGSRIARSVCDDSVYGRAFHMEGSKDEEPVNVISSSPH